MVDEPEVMPDIEQYLDEPQGDGDQDESPSLVGLLPRGFTPPTTSRTWDGALQWLANQSVNPSRNWAGLCQMCIRSADACPGGFASAKAQWFGMEAKFRFPGGDPKDAPIGADLFSVSHNPDSAAFLNGHIIKKARPFNNGAMGAWSTDALRVGNVDKINPIDLYKRWNHEYLGWGYQINGRIIDVKDPAPVRKPYNDIADALPFLEQAADAVRRARAKAKDVDPSDVGDIQDLIDRILGAKEATRRKYKNLRHE